MGLKGKIRLFKYEALCELKETHYDQQTVRRNNNEKFHSKITNFFIERNQFSNTVLCHVGMKLGLNLCLPQGCKQHPLELDSAKVLVPCEGSARSIVGIQYIFAGWINALGTLLNFQNHFPARLERPSSSLSGWKVETLVRGATCCVTRQVTLSSSFYRCVCSWLVHWEFTNWLPLVLPLSCTPDLL